MRYEEPIDVGVVRVSLVKGGENHEERLKLWNESRTWPRHHISWRHDRRPGATMETMKHQYDFYAGRTGMASLAPLGFFVDYGGYE